MRLGGLIFFSHVTCRGGSTQRAGWVAAPPTIFQKEKGKYVSPARDLPTIEERGSLDGDLKS